ncbi:MAG: hypothetical protein O9327_03140 [Polaromonas sp.]|nr:hypothetical protein [Polaromonas sp.]
MKFPSSSDDLDDLSTPVDPDEPNGHGLVGRLIGRLRSAMGLERPVFEPAVALPPEPGPEASIHRRPGALASKMVDPKAIRFDKGFDARTLMLSLIDYAQAYESKLYGDGLLVQPHDWIPPCAFPALAKVPGFGERTSSADESSAFSLDAFASAAHKPGVLARNKTSLDPAGMPVQGAWLLNAVMVRAALRMGPFALTPPTLHAQTGRKPKEQVPSDDEIDFDWTGKAPLKSTQEDPLSLGYLRSLATQASHPEANAIGYSIVDGPATVTWSNDLPTPDRLRLPDEFMTQFQVGPLSKPLVVHTELRFAMRERFLHLINDEAAQVVAEYESATTASKATEDDERDLKPKWNERQQRSAEALVRMCYQLGFAKSDAAFIDIMGVRQACQPFFDVDRVAVAHAMRHSRYGGPSGLDLQSLALHSRQDVQMLIQRQSEHGAGAWFRYPAELVAEMVRLYAGRSLTVESNEDESFTPPDDITDVVREITSEFKRHASASVWEMLRKVSPKYLSGIFLGESTSRMPFCLFDQSMDGGARLGRRLALWMNTWASAGRKVVGERDDHPGHLPWSSITWCSTAQPLLFDRDLTDAEALRGLTRLTDIAQRARAAGVTAGAFKLNASPLELVGAPNASLETLLNYERRQGSDLQLPSPFIRLCTRQARAQREAVEEGFASLLQAKLASEGIEWRLSFTNWAPSASLPKVVEAYSGEMNVGRSTLVPAQFPMDTQCLSLMFSRKPVAKGSGVDRKQSPDMVAAVGIAMAAKGVVDFVRPHGLEMSMSPQASARSYAVCSKSTALAFINEPYVAAFNWSKCKGWQTRGQSVAGMPAPDLAEEPSKLPFLVPDYVVHEAGLGASARGDRTPWLATVADATHSWSRDGEKVAEMAAQSLQALVVAKPLEIAVVLPHLATGMWATAESKSAAEAFPGPGIDQRSVFALFRRAIGSEWMTRHDRLQDKDHHDQRPPEGDHAAIALVVGNARGIASVCKRWSAYQAWRTENPAKISYDELVEGGRPLTQSVLDLALESPSPSVFKMAVQGILRNPRIDHDDVRRLIAASVHRICETHPTLLVWLDARELAPALSAQHVSLIEAGSHASELATLAPVLANLRFKMSVGAASDQMNSTRSGGPKPEVPRSSSARVRL